MKELRSIKYEWSLRGQRDIDEARRVIETARVLPANPRDQRSAKV